MMGWTDRHFRFFMRQICPSALLYTEMLNPEALIFGKCADFLRFHPQEAPLAFQLGGSNTTSLAKASKIIQARGYHEINLNVGCPSPRGAHSLFGAHLIKYPALVADCFKAMQDQVSIPVTIKTRIGVDELDSLDRFLDFIGGIASAGCRIFVIHARKAWLNGLSAEQNRSVPPLRYDYVHQLKKALPHLQVVINGGITTLEEVHQHLSPIDGVSLDGVMIGRQAYKDPYSLSGWEAQLGLIPPDSPRLRPSQLLENCREYARAELELGTPLRNVMRHLAGLFRHSRAAKVFRRFIATEVFQAGANLQTFEQAIELAAKLESPRPLKTPSTELAEISSDSSSGISSDIS